jgi:crotonobetainyl-CoA:carnitine CoA-transferase CaiB-like acyl-CoA transferase
VPGPLDGVRVVACSIAQAGTVPYALMADLGADVIKVEVPGRGDGSRRSAAEADWPSAYFETNNRGVRSLTLNLKTDRGREILRRLVATVDVFGQNFRPGAAEQNGFGYEDLRAVNPRLVYVSVSGYGPAGPHAHLPATDAMAQALGGITEVFSTPGERLRTGIASIADETCALVTFGAIMTGLYCARQTGVGQRIDTSLLGGQVRLMGWTLTNAMWRNEPPITGRARITGSRRRAGISATFVDGAGLPFVFQLAGDEWTVAMRALGFLDALAADGLDDLGLVHVSEAERNRLFARLDALFATGSRERWVEVLRAADIVAAPVNTLLQAAADPDVVANGYVTEVDYPDFGKRLRVHGVPWRFSETPASIGRAPALGEHNAEILGGLGFDADGIARLRADGII